MMAGDAPPQPVLTLEEYQRQELEDLKRMRLKVRDDYRTQLINKLETVYSDSLIVGVVEGLLDGEKLRPNADSDSEDIDDDGSQRVHSGIDENEINNYAQEYIDIYERVFLLIRLPVDRANMPFEEDENSRKRQYENFCKIYPNLNPEHELYKKSQNTDCSVQSYSDLKIEMSNFLTGLGARAYMALIFVNGHGSEEGLNFNDGKHIPLNSFLKDINAMMNARVGLPHFTKVVFGQCYGHLYTQPTDDCLQVECFTNDTKRITNILRVRDPFTGDVTDYRHLELETHAQQELALADEKAKESMDNVPSTLMNTQEEVADDAEEDMVQ